MYEQIRKNFFNSKSLFPEKKGKKTSFNIGVVNYRLKNLPTININSKNSEIFGFSGEDKNINSNLNEIMLRQKALTLSKTPNIPFNKKIHSNYNLRKKSSNIIERNPQFNNLFLNTMNNLKNKSSKIITKNYKSVQIMPNSNINSNNNGIKLSLSTLPIKSIKSPDDFGISDEDRIFNQFKKKKKKAKSPLKKPKSKIKIKLKKKKFNPFSSYDSALVKVYKKIPKIINNIENTKKLKGTMSLLKYQNLLMDVGAKNLNRQTREKLNNKFITLRNFTNKPYNLFKESLESIENEEEKIIDSINTQQNYYLRKMKENKYNSLTSLGNLGSISLPNLKFFKLGKSKKKPKHRYKFK